MHTSFGGSLSISLAKVYVGWWVPGFFSWQSKTSFVTNCSRMVTRSGRTGSHQSSHGVFDKIGTPQNASLFVPQNDSNSNTSPGPVITFQIQLKSDKMARLLSKPYVNEVTLSGPPTPHPPKMLLGS